MKIRNSISIISLILAIVLLFGLFAFGDSLGLVDRGSSSDGSKNSLSNKYKVLSGTWTWFLEPTFTQDFILEDISFTVAGLTETFDKIIIDYISDDNLAIYYEKSGYSYTAYQGNGTWLDTGYRVITFEENFMVTESFYNEYIRNASQGVT